MVTASCFDLLTTVLCLVGCQLGTFWRSHQSAWSLTENFFPLTVQHGMRPLKDPVKKRNGLSALCPLDLISCLSQLVLSCLFCLVVVTVKTKRRRRSWRKMKRRKICWAEEQLLSADATSPCLSPALSLSAGSSRVPFLSLVLERGSDYSSFAEVERESDGTFWEDSAFSDFWIWTCCVFLGF